jgi:hypothetical protein
MSSSSSFAVHLGMRRENVSVPSAGSRALSDQKPFPFPIRAAKEKQADITSPNLYQSQCIRQTTHWFLSLLVAFVVLLANGCSWSLSFVKFLFIYNV